MFLSSYRNTSGSLGEREMLWEHEPQASISTAFSSSPKLSRILQTFDKFVVFHHIRQLFEALLFRSSLSTCIILSTTLETHSLDFSPVLSRNFVFATFVNLLGPFNRQINKYRYIRISGHISVRAGDNLENIFRHSLLKTSKK